MVCGGVTDMLDCLIAHLVEAVGHAGTIILSMMQHQNIEYRRITLF
jgi:hypothetical protein